MTAEPPTASRLPRTLILLAAVVTVAAALAGAPAVALVATVACVASVMPGPTLLRRLVFALPVLTGLAAAAFTVLAVISVETDVQWVMVGVAVACAVVAVVFPPLSAPVADTVDAWSAAATVAALALVARAAVTWHAPEILARLAKHTDGIRHIALGAAVERHGGYVTFSPDPHRLPGLQHYPQGGAGIIAIVLRAFAGRHPDIASTTVVGFWVLVATLALMTWVFTTLALSLARRTNAFTGRPHECATVAVIAVAVAAVGPHFVVYEPGYFTQDVALVALLTSMCLMLGSRDDHRVVATSAALLIALAQTWYLLLPVVGLLVSWWWREHRPTKADMAWMLAAAPFVVFPLVTGPSPTRQLVVSGGTPQPSKFVIAAMLVGGGAALPALRRQAIARRRDLLTVTMAATFALMLLVGTVEIAGASESSAYYAIKLFVLVLILGGLAIAVVLPAAARSSDPRDRVLAVVMGVSIVGMTAAGWPYYVNKTSTPTTRNVREAELYFSLRPTVESSAGLTVIYDGCDERDRFLTHALATLGNEFDPSRFRDMTRYMNSTGSPPSGLAALSRDPGVRNLRVITAQPCAPHDIDELRQLPHVTVIEKAQQTSG